MTPQTLIEMTSDDAAEEAARQLVTCPSCFVPIGRGHLCCHSCFKVATPNGTEPLKWSGLGYREWLALIHPSTNPSRP